MVDRISDNEDWGDVRERLNRRLDAGVSAYDKARPVTGHGDSQMYGYNNADKPYVDGTRLKPEYRFFDQFAASLGATMPATNFGVGGVRISYNLGAPSSGSTKSHFNKMGYLTSASWVGTAIFMCGFNNIGSSFNAQQQTQAFHDTLHRAHEAMIARALIDDYAGIGATGIGSGGAAISDNWSTSGVAADQTMATMGGFDNREVSAFYYGSPSGDRKRLNLAGGKFIRFRATNKRAVGLFFETDRAGGSFSVQVNGCLVGQFSLAADTGQDEWFPFVVWIEGLPAVADIQIIGQNSAAPVYWLAYGWTLQDSAVGKLRRIIYGSTSGNTFSTRPLDVIGRMASCAEAAVGAFGRCGYPVTFAAPYMTWDQSTDSEPDDPAHITDLGNYKICQAFQRHYAVPGRKSPNVVLFADIDILPKPPREQIYLPSGKHQAATANSLLAFGASDFTVALFVRPDLGGISNQGRYFGGSSGCFTLFPDTSAGGLKVSSLSVADVLASYVGPQPGHRSHVAYSRISGVGYLYFNGVLVASGPDTTNYSQSIANLSWSNAAFGYRGHMDQVRVYRRGLTLAEVNDLIRNDTAGADRWEASTGGTKCCFASGETRAFTGNLLDLSSNAINFTYT